MNKGKINKFSIDMSVEPFNFEIESTNPNIEVMERIKHKIHSHPLHSRMKVRVFYKGKNRNGSFIDNNVEQQLINTLPNTPIVGEYWEAIEDFGTHASESRTDSNGEIKIKRRTSAFGVVPSDTEVWYESVIDKDGSERNYVCCEAVLWDKRYEELDSLLKSGRPQSMELDMETLEGEWIEVEYDYLFKYTTAYLSALCILGQDIEPCFEGASFLTFTNKDSLSEFKKECEEMFKDIRSSCNLDEKEVLDKVNNFSLSNDDNKDKTYQNMTVFTTGLNINNKGGKFKMGEIKLKFATENDIREILYKSINAFNAENDTYSFKYVITNIKNNIATVFNHEDNTYYNIKFSINGNEVKTEAPIVTNVLFQSDEEINRNKQAITNYANLKAETVKLQNEINSFNEKMKDYQLTTEEYTAIKTDADKFKEISEEYTKLKEYMLNNERVAKQEIINKFSKLGEAELKVYKESIDKFTAEQLDEKLSALAFKKGISLHDEEDNKPKPVYSFTDVAQSKSTTVNAPGWFNLVLKREDELNNFLED